MAGSCTPYAPSEEPGADAAPHFRARGGKPPLASEIKNRTDPLLSGQGRHGIGACPSSRQTVKNHPVEKLSLKIMQTPFLGTFLGTFEFAVAYVRGICAQVQTPIRRMHGTK